MNSDRNAAYVADGLIPPSKPPASEVGVIHWLRGNLFNGVISSILTLVSITAMVMLVPPLVDWTILKGVWNASSLDECLEIVVATHGKGARGACWAVITERIDVLLFGFYPPELYWRPVLAFVLLFVALAPVLISSLPRRMLWFSAIYPVIAFALIWGIAGKFTHLGAVDTTRLSGLLLTIIIAVTGIAMAIPIGVVLALGRQSSMFFFRTICVVIVEFIRGVPLIVLLFAAVILPPYFLPPGTSMNLILWTAFVVAMPSGVHMADAIRGGLAAVPPGQYEAATALGLKYWKATGLVILPQAVKISAPRIVITFAKVFRDTSLISIIGMLDPLVLLSVIRANPNWNGIQWELFAVVALLYWVFSFSITRYSMYLERKLKARH